MLLDALADVAAGAHSALECRYTGVERIHHLPKARRQVRDEATGRRWLDAVYDNSVAPGLVDVVNVELDGRLAHSDLHRRLRDMASDNRAAVLGRYVLRYGWQDLAGSGCAVAAQVAAVLIRAGWTGRPRPCGASCGL